MVSDIGFVAGIGAVVGDGGFGKGENKTDFGSVGIITINCINIMAVY